MTTGLQVFPVTRIKQNIPKTKPVFVLRPENRFQLDPLFVRQFVGKQPKWGFGLLSYTVYKRTYARRVDKHQLTNEYQRYLGLSTTDAKAKALATDQTTEEFWQTCVRVVEGTSSILKQQVRDTGQHWSDGEEQTHAQEMFQRLWDLKFTPPGRGLWGMGTKALELRGSAFLNNCGFVSTEHILDDFSTPFCDLMDFLMLGVGMGFDVLGQQCQLKLTTPTIREVKVVVDDSREGWIEVLRTVLNAFVGKDTLPAGWDYSKIRKEGTAIKTFGGTASGYKPLERLRSEVTKLCWRYVREDKAVDSTFITDLMNMIGACVVAGNVRRSAEIALGDAADSAFLQLKSAEGLIHLQQRQALIETNHPKAQKLAKKIQYLQKRQRKFDVLDPKFGALQQRIHKAEQKKLKLLQQYTPWTAIEDEIKAHPLRSHRWASNNTIKCYAGMDYTDPARQAATNGEPGFTWPEVFQAYGRLIDPPNYKDRMAKGMNPCGEQTLFANELCCLVETYPTRHETLEDFLTTLKYAYRYAKAVTLVPTHNQKTNAVMVRNRRIGTSMAGIIEMYSRLGMQECIRWWDKAYKEICYWDTEYSGWLGVNESIKKTSIKPGGTTPLLVGVEGGMKAPISQYYMRTIRMDHISPLVKVFEDAGYRVEPDYTTPRTKIVYFPLKAPDNVRFAKSLSLWEQALLFTKLQTYWSDNMVSATLTFQEHEKDDIARVLQAYEGSWKSVSFLPFDNHGYLQAPYIPCTEEQYVQMKSQIKPVSLEGLTLEHDTDDKYCSGGFCALPAKT